MLLRSRRLCRRPKPRTFAHHSLETSFDGLDGSFAEMKKLDRAELTKHLRLALIAKEEVETVALVQRGVGRVACLATDKVLDIRTQHFLHHFCVELKNS